MLKRRLRELAIKVPAIEEFINRNIERINGAVGSPASFDRLDALLAAQAYRLCHWRAAGDDVNYRRFFDINQLAAVCMEQPVVFYQTHRLIMQLVADGAVSGLRIDHIDGLFSPERYLQRLQWAYLAELVDRALKKDGEPKANGDCYPHRIRRKSCRGCESSIDYAIDCDCHGQDWTIGSLFLGLMHCWKASPLTSHLQTAMC